MTSRLIDLVSKNTVASFLSRSVEIYHMLRLFFFLWVGSVIWFQFLPFFVVFVVPCGARMISRLIDLVTKNTVAAVSSRSVEIYSMLRHFFFFWVGSVILFPFLPFFIVFVVPCGAR